MMNTKKVLESCGLTVASGILGGVVGGATGALKIGATQPTVNKTAAVEPEQVPLAQITLQK